MVAWSRLRRVTAPVGPAVSLPSAKAHLRVDHDADDAYIEGLVEVAQSGIEGPHGIGVALLTQTWALHQSSLRFPVELPMGPVQAVTSITYLDGDDNEQTLDPNDYRLAVNCVPVVLYTGGALPAGHDVAITFTAGFGTAADVPATLRHAILIMVGHLYAHREAAIVGATPAVMPLGYEALTDPYRVGRFGA